MSTRTVCNSGVRFENPCPQQYSRNCLATSGHSASLTPSLRVAVITLGRRRKSVTICVNAIVECPSLSRYLTIATSTLLSFLLSVPGLLTLFVLGGSERTLCVCTGRRTLVLLSASSQTSLVLVTHVNKARTSCRNTYLRCAVRCMHGMR